MHCVASAAAAALLLIMVGDILVDSSLMARAVKKFDVSPIRRN